MANRVAYIVDGTYIVDRADSKLMANTANDNGQQMTMDSK
jgi:hypothetical protein